MTKIAPHGRGSDPSRDREGAILGRELVVVRGVERGEPGEILGELVQHENRISGANRDAGAAIDAIVGLDEELRRFGETGLILLGVDAIHRAGLHAQFILGTGIGNYVCHEGSMCNSAASVIWKKTGGETRHPPAIGWGKARKGRRSRAAGGYPTRALRPAGAAVSLRAGLRSAAAATVAVRRRTWSVTQTRNIGWRAFLSRSMMRLGASSRKMDLPSVSR